MNVVGGREYVEQKILRLERERERETRGVALGKTLDAVAFYSILDYKEVDS